MSKIKNKGVSAAFILVSAIVSLAGLILYGVYIGNGGAMNSVVLCLVVLGILLELSLLFLEGDLSDVAAILAPVLLVIGAVTELGDGIGNIADWASGIICFGNPDLAQSNLIITGVLLIGVLLSVIVSFLSRGSKKKSA